MITCAVPNLHSRAAVLALSWHPLPSFYLLPSLTSFRPLCSCHPSILPSARPRLPNTTAELGSSPKVTQARHPPPPDHHDTAVLEYVRRVSSTPPTTHSGYCQSLAPACSKEIRSAGARGRRGCSSLVHTLGMIRTSSLEVTRLDDLHGWSKWRVRAGEWECEWRVKGDGSERVGGGGMGVKGAGDERRWG